MTTTDPYVIHDKLQALAALFGPEGVTGDRQLSQEAGSGLCFILEDCAREIQACGREMEKRARLKSGREAQLERFMESLASQMEQDGYSEGWGQEEFKQVADNIRHTLDR